MLAGISFLLLLAIPVNFNYWVFALITLLNGIGQGLFSSPNAAAMMSLEKHERGSHAV